MKLVKVSHYQHPYLEKYVISRTPVENSRLFLRVLLVGSLLFALSLLYDVLFR